MFIVFGFVVFISKNNTLSYNFRGTFNTPSCIYPQRDAFLQSLLSSDSYLDSMKTNFTKGLDKGVFI